MKKSNMSKQQKEELHRDAMKDIAFQEQLETYDKQALCLLITQLTATSTTRDWVLSYVANIQDVYKRSGVIPEKSLREDLLEAIANERLADEINFGPVRMSPRTIKEWLDLIHRQLSEADRHAAFGRNMKALNAMLRVASGCVAALEDRLGKAIEEGTPALQAVIMEVTEKADRPVSDNGQPYDSKNKTTDEDASSPAANLNGSDQ